MHMSRSISMQKKKVKICVGYTGYLTKFIFLKKKKKNKKNFFKKKFNNFINFKNFKYFLVD